MVNRPASRNDPAIPLFHGQDALAGWRRVIDEVHAAGQAAERRGAWVSGAYEFLRFGIKQGWACLFGGLMVALLIGTHFLYPKGAPLARTATSSHVVSGTRIARSRAKSLTVNGVEDAGTTTRF